MPRAPYVEPSIEEGQALLRLWQACTSKPMTSREVEFARAVRTETRNACAEMLNLTNDQLRLMAGEMSAQELRTVKAVLAGLRAKVESKGS